MQPNRLSVLDGYVQLILHSLQVVRQPTNFSAPLLRCFGETIDFLLQLAIRQRQLVNVLERLCPQRFDFGTCFPVSSLLLLQTFQLFPQPINFLERLHPQCFNFSVSFLLMAALFVQLLQVQLQPVSFLVALVPMCFSVVEQLDEVLEAGLFVGNKRIRVQICQREAHCSMPNRLCCAGVFSGL